MHLNKILDQIKHHPSPTEAIDKLGKALEKHEGDSTPLVGSEISAGNRYWVYYNKCDNVIQVMNHYTVAAAPAA